MGANRALTIPYREWRNLELITLKAHDPNSHNFNQATDWDLLRHPSGTIGEYMVGANNYHYWVTILRPSAADFEDKANLDILADVGLIYTLGKERNVGHVTTASIFTRIINNSNIWEYPNVVSRFYDGINGWDAYGANGNTPGSSAAKTDVFTAEDIVGLGSKTFEPWTAAYFGGAYIANNFKTEIYTMGYVVYLFTAGFSDALDPGDDIRLTLVPQAMRLRYQNPIVNSISKRVLPTGGGEALILSGLGLHITDAELSENGGGTVVAPSFKSYVRKVQFVGRNGEGTYELVKDIGFTVDSDSQITIPVMPNLPKGTYNIRLSKNLTGMAEFWTDAGAWRAYEDGLVYEGAAFVLWVNDELYTNPRGGEIVLTDWTWKDADGNTITEHIGPIDIRADGVFYHGRLISYSGYSREINDKSGMFSVSDMSIELVNNDKRYSTLLANYFLKGQYVGIYHAWKNQPENWKTSLIKMVVDDYSLQGNIFRVELKDVSNKYFLVNIPRFVINDTDYPSAPDSSLGRPIPEALGLHYLTGATPGALEAIKVTALQYIAAAGSLHSVTEVYSEGVEKTAGADYTISIADGGRTYINFVASQGEKKVTFNCKGYMYGPWNSADGYVQNPAYIVGFVIAFLLEVPISRIHTGSFDDVAAIYAGLNFDTSGRWAGQEAQTGETVMQELMISYGSKLFQDNEGRFKLDRKDISSPSATLRIFEQIHNLRPALRKFNLNQAFNFLKSNFDYYPPASLYKGIMELRNQTAIDNFESEIEPDFTLDLRWLDSSLFANYRTIEELIKYSEGYHTAEFLWPSSLINDIDIMTTFLFQDPFGIDAGGQGEEGRYYYIVSIRPDFVSNVLEVTAVDLSWLAEQQSGSGSG